MRRPRSDESVCGDLPIALEVGQTAALFGAIDGLGHGEPAAAAAQCASDVVHITRAEPLDDLMQHCHRALTETRGVAMTLARIDFETDTMSWSGIGNVTADLVVKHPAGAEVRSSAFLAGGIVGYRMPQPLLTHQVAISPGDLLVIATDGVAEDYFGSIEFAAPATEIAQQILADHSKEADDALVLAARHRGPS